MRHASNLDRQRGERLKSLRKRDRLTQSELAEKVGRTTSAISKIEKGEGLSSDLLSIMAQIFGVDIEYILNGKTDGKPAITSTNKKNDVEPFKVMENEKIELMQHQIDSHRETIDALKMLCDSYKSELELKTSALLDMQEELRICRESLNTQSA